MGQRKRKPSTVIDMRPQQRARPVTLGIGIGSSRRTQSVVLDGADTDESSSVSANELTSLDEKMTLIEDSILPKQRDLQANASRELDRLMVGQLKLLGEKRALCSAKRSEVGSRNSCCSTQQYSLWTH